MTLQSRLLESARTGNAGITFIDFHGEDYMSYGELYESALRVLGALQDIGIRPGNELVIQADDNKFFLTIFWACILGNILPVPLSTGIQEEQKAKVFRIWKFLHRPFLVTDREQFKRLESYTAQRDCPGSFSEIQRRFINISLLLESSRTGITETAGNNHIAYIQFSSGSTGEPKGICLSHANLLANVEDIIRSLRITSSDKLLSWMPLTHDMGVIGFHLTGLILGIDQVSIATSTFIKRPLCWMESAAATKSSVLYSPNSGLNYFLAAFQKAQDIHYDLACIRIIVNGAEPISAPICDQFMRAMRPYGLREDAMVFAYGLAEASVAVSIMPVHTPMQFYWLHRQKLHTGDRPERVDADHPHRVQFADAGIAVGNCDIRICDERDRELPAGTLGNIQIRGLNVTMGYYNNTPATDELFTPDNWLRTGDIGFLHHGRLVVTGRKKNIIIINGQNYYPHDIEQVVQRAGICEPGKIAACGIHLPETSEEELAIFILYKEPWQDFMPVVSATTEAVWKNTGIWTNKVIPVKRIPKTTSGKVKYFALAQQVLDGHFVDYLSFLEEKYSFEKEEYQRGTNMQDMLIAICNDLLKSWNITPDTDFFDMRLNSIMAIRLASRIQKLSGIDLPVEDIFRFPGISALAQQMEYLAGHASASREAGLFSRSIPAAGQQPYPGLSMAQRRLWVLYCMNKRSTAYNESCVYEISGPLDLPVMRKSFEDLVKRHAVLRTNFIDVDDLPVQVVHPFELHELNFMHVDQRKSNGNDQTWNGFLKPYVNQVFDLSNDPLYRIIVVSVQEDRHILCVIMHHIITDEWSGKIFINEFLALYNAFSNGLPGSLPALKIQYSDYAVWVNDEPMAAHLEQNKLYWKQELSGVTDTLELPVDHKRPAEKQSTGDGVYLTIDAELMERLRSLCRTENVTLFMVMLTGVYALLSKYTGQYEMIIGIPSAGRRHPDTIGLAGFFINLLPVKLSLTGADSIRAVLQKVKRKCLDAYEHELFPFENLVHEMNMQPDMSRSPLFDVLVTMSEANPIPAGENYAVHNIRLKKWPSVFFNAKYDITFYIEEGEGPATVLLEFDTHLFNRSTVEKMAAHYRNVLTALAASIDVPLARLDYMRMDEKDALLTLFNKPLLPQADDTLLNLFHRQVLLHGEDTAVVCRDHFLSYREIEERSDRLAAYLVGECEVRPGDFIALLLDRSENVVIVILGVWKAGGVYIPIDPSYPAARMDMILQQAGACVMITDAANYDYCADHKEKAGHKIYLVDADSPVHALNACPALLGTEPGLAYIMYTSGSTGIPKGVEVYHGSVVNTLLHLQQEPGITEKDSFLAVSNYTFDISVAELFLPLISGAKLLIATKEEVTNGQDLRKYIEQEKPTHIQATPSMWNMLIDGGWEGHSFLTVITCGEMLTDLLKLGLLQRAGSVWNMYGPTETTIFSTGKKILAPNEPVTVGCPIRNTQVYILDEHQELVAPGIYGEIYIGGRGLARGYLHQQNLTGEKFVPVMYHDGGFCYRTGDIGRWLADGTIELKGRRDTQIKLRGFRIETAEIESVIESHGGFRSAVVVAQHDASGDPFLSAFVVTRRELADWQDELRNFLQSRLPAFMIPSRFVALPSLPVTPNGKADRKSLAAYHFVENSVSDRQLPSAGSPYEKRLSEIWEQILNIKSIGVADNFFNIGGHSLKGNKLINTIYREWGIEMKLTDIFRNPTIRQQAELISRLEGIKYNFIELE